MMRIGSDVLLKPLPCFGYGLKWRLLEVRDLPPQSAGPAHREELGEECCGALFPCVNSFLALIKPLFRLSGEGNGKQTEPDTVLRDILDDDGVAQLKEVLKVGVGILTWQATELACLHHRDEASADLEASIPHIDSGPSRHVGNSGSGVVTECLSHSDWCGWCWNG